MQPLLELPRSGVAKLADPFAVRIPIDDLFP